MMTQQDCADVKHLLTGTKWKHYVHSVHDMTDTARLDHLV